MPTLEESRRYSDNYSGGGYVESNASGGDYEYPGSSDSEPSPFDGDFNNDWEAAMGENDAVSGMGGIGVSEPSAGGPPAVAFPPSDRTGNYVGQTNSAANYPFSNSNIVPWSQAKQTEANRGTFNRTTTPAAKPLGQVSINERLFPGGVAPVFKGPTWDESAVRSLRQKLAAPGLTKLRSTLRQALAKSYENPAVRSLMLRSSLAGYGEGVSSITAGAEGRARTQYGSDFSRQYQEASDAYNRALNLGRTVQRTQSYGSEEELRKLLGEQYGQPA